MARNPAIPSGASCATKRLSERSLQRPDVNGDNQYQVVPKIDSERVSIARIVRPHGLRGEVAAEILTGFPQRLLSLESVWLWDGTQELRDVEVRSCRLTTSRGGQALFQFSHCNSIEDAQALVGWHVQIPLSERLPLASGQYYITDLEGCAVREEGGLALGEVAHVQETGDKVMGTPVLLVQSGKQELLIPLAAEICVRIDLAAREIVVRLPDGLRELNAPKPPNSELSDPKLPDPGMPEPKVLEAKVTDPKLNEFSDPKI